MYNDQYEIIKALPDDQAGLLMKSIFNYQANGVEPELDPLMNALFMAFRTTLDRDANKFSEECQRRAEAGRKGGLRTQEKRKQCLSKSSTTQANQATLKPTQANQADSESESESVTDSENENESDIKDVANAPEKNKESSNQSPKLAKESPNPPVPLAPLPHHLEAWDDWLQYKKEKKQGYKPAGMKALVKKFNKYPADVIRKAVDESMENNWSGLFPEKVGHGVDKSVTDWDRV